MISSGYDGITIECTFKRTLQTTDKGGDLPLTIPLYQFYGLSSNPSEYTVCRHPVWENLSLFAVMNNNYTSCYVLGCVSKNKWDLQQTHKGSLDFRQTSTCCWREEWVIFCSFEEGGIYVNFCVYVQYVLCAYVCMYVLCAYVCSYTVCVYILCVCLCVCVCE